MAEEDRHLYDREAWCQMFVQELIRLQPALDTPSHSTALTIAQAMYEHSSATPPELAARIYHLPIFGPSR